MQNTTDYRAAILHIAESIARPGEDWELNLFTGGPEVIDHDEALGLAEWLESDAEDEWGPDARLQVLASRIRELAG